MLALVAATPFELTDRLTAAAAWLRAGPPVRMPADSSGHYGEHDPDTPVGPLTFVYPGQGAQRIRAMRGLYDTIPVLRSRLDELDAIVQAATGVSPLEDLYPDGELDENGQARAAQRLARTEVCQPALAMIAIALTELLAATGLRPGQTLGHSVGELCAAAAAGVAQPDDLLRLVARRGQLMAQHQPAEPGAMLALLATEDEVTTLLDGLADVWVANVNGPRQVVVSGPALVIADVAARAASNTIQATPLEVSHAFHSPQVASAARHCFRTCTACPYVPVTFPCSPPSPASHTARRPTSARPWNATPSARSTSFRPSRRSKSTSRRYRARTRSFTLDPAAPALAWYGLPCETRVGSR